MTETTPAQPRRLVQLVITDEQAELTAAALRDAEKAMRAQLDDLGGDAEVWMEADTDAAGRLALLFQDASENPIKYKPSPRLDIVRRVAKATKVPVPQSRRKRRASRHQRRQADRMYFRRNREYIEAFNKAQETMEAERKEHEATVAEVNERVKDQPTFDITDGFGNTILGSVPAEFIRDKGGKAPLTLGLKPRIVVPGQTTVDEMIEGLA